MSWGEGERGRGGEGWGMEGGDDTAYGSEFVKVSFISEQIAGG